MSFVAIKDVDGIHTYTHAQWNTYTCTCPRIPHHIWSLLYFSLWIVNVLV